MHLIADRFTRLEPGTDFRGLDIALGLERPEFLEPIPAHWRDLHDPLLAANWHARLEQILRNPVQIEKHPSGHRHVSVLGDAIYDIAPDGTVQCFAWRHNAGGRIRLVPFPDNEIVAIGAPYGGLWMKGYAQGALQRMCHAHAPDLHDLCADYVQWLMRQMLAKHWTPETAAVVREQVKVALQLDPQVQILAATMCRTHDPETVRMSEYNYCLRNRARVERLEQEAPRLALLHSLLYQELSLDMEATQAMAAFLEQGGVSRGAWRLLVQEGSDWMQPFLEFYRLPHGAGPAVVHDVLSLVQMFGTQERIPFRILHALMAVGGNPNWKRQKPTYAQEYEDIRDLVARVGHLYFDADQPERLKISDNCDAIFNWGLDHWAKRPARSRRTIRLVGLLRLVSTHQKTQELIHRDKEPWNVRWLLDTPALQLEIHILDSAVDVWRESQAMHHCADKYIDRCTSEEYLMASIRNRRRDGVKKNEHQRGVATMGFKLTESGFALHNISGFANRKVTSHHLAIARDCLRQLNEQFIQRLQHEVEMAHVNVGEAANEAANGGGTLGLRVGAA